MTVPPSARTLELREKHTVLRPTTQRLNRAVEHPGRERRKGDMGLGNSHALKWSVRVNLDVGNEFRFIKDSINVQCSLCISP